MNAQSDFKAASSATLRDAEGTVHEQISQLRAQVEKLISERAAPYIADVAGKAETVARRGYDVARENVDAVSTRVKDQPLTAVIVAGVVGFLLARMFR
jgi:ElaB/YqjD/DUF883 family membrane-anchored ribosome-binding protein